VILISYASYTRPTWTLRAARRPRTRENEIVNVDAEVATLLS